MQTTLSKSMYSENRAVCSQDIPGSNRENLIWWFVSPFDEASAKVPMQEKVNGRANSNASLLHSDCFEELY